MSQLLMPKKLKLTGSMKTYKTFYWNAKVEVIPGVTGKFGLGVQNEAGLTEFCQENTLVIENTLFQNNMRDNSIHGHHQMVNTEI